MVKFADHFHQNSIARSVEESVRQRWFIENRQRREKAIERAEDIDPAVMDILAVALPTPTEIEEFQAELDGYDETTVKALMENERQLDKVQKEIHGMLAEAHVLEDGRRVFKTEDGTMVFDEFGARIGLDDLDPDSIGDHKTKWEPFSSAINREDQLQIERKEILEFQEKVDHARKRSDEKDFTAQERDELSADLENVVPHAVAKHLPDDYPALQ